MKIGHLLESRVLLEGGNLSINGHEAQHLDLKVTNRSYMVPKLNALLNAINSSYAKIFKEPLWSPELLASGEFLSGSSLHFFNVKGIDDETFVTKKPTVGDIDTMVDKEKELNLQDFLNGYQNKKIGPGKLLGFQRGNEQFSALFEMTDPPVKVQIDFEFVAFADGKPTDWSKFSHSSSWDDLQAGVKGVFHKWLIQAFTSLTRKNFILRKMKGRGKLRQEVDTPTTDNMYSFAVSSKEGGGLRAKYEPVMDGNKPLVIDGLPVMREAPTSGYEQNIGQIFSNILGEKLTPQEAKALANNFWSYTGLLQVINKLMDPQEKQQVLTGFLDKTIGPGAQGMYKNNPDKDIQEKTTAINTMLKTLGMNTPSDFNQMLDTYRKAYKMTGTDEGVETRKDTVKQMAKRTLDEAAPDYRRKGIEHIYNPGSTVEMKDLDFIEFCKEIIQDGGKFQGVPINLKVDGAGVRFGRDPQGKPFFMTSRVTKPMYLDNYGDFEAYGRSQGQSEERLNFTKNYDEALRTILTSDFMKDIPPDTIVQAEMLYNPMAKKTSDGYEFVNIPYDPSKLGSEMTLVPISVKQYSTGETSPDAAKIKKELIKDSADDVKLINNTLSHKGINVSNIIAPIVKNEEALTQALSTRGNSPAKEKAKSILSKARQALSKAIISGNIEGKDQLGDTIEGLVINMPSGRLAKVTSPDMQNKMAAKQLANKKPTEGGQRVKPAVVTIGSFAGHKGHQQLIDQTIATAQSVGGDPYILVSPVMGPDDPIPPADKVKTLQSLYPQYANNIQVWNPQGTPMKKIEKELVLPSDSPYNKIILLVGDDRYESMSNWMSSLEKRMKDPAAIAKFGGTQHQVDFETIRTERDPNKGGTGISFTQLRNKLKDPNASEQDKLNYWMQAFDGQTLGQEWIKHLMDVTAKNMGIQQQAIKEYITRIKPMLETATPAQKKKIYEQLTRLKEFARDDFDGDRRPNFLPWEEFIGDLTAILDEHFSVVQSRVKTTIKARFVPHDPMEFGPTMLYSYYDTRAGRTGANSKRGAIQVGKYFDKGSYFNSSDPDIQNQLLTGFHLLKGHPFERHFDLTGENVQKIADIIIGNTQGAYQIQPQQEVEEGWVKNALAAGALAGAALTGAGHAQAADLSSYATPYLQQVVSGEHPRPMVSVDDAKSELSARANGKQQATSPAATSSSAGYSQEYLQKAADPNRIGRYLISVEKAQELLGKMNEAAGIERKEGYRGRTTPDIEYIVRDDNDKIVRICKTKKEAKMWYDMVTLSQEEMWAKYPELKVNESTNDIFNLADPETQEILKYAQRHYPDAPNAQAAFMKFVVHALKHSEEDDKKQDAAIDHLDNEVDDLEHKVDLSESSDYLEEK